MDKGKSYSTEEIRELFHKMDFSGVMYNEFNADIKTITDYCAIYGLYFKTPEMCEDLWKRFSEEKYCAGWLIVNNSHLDDFVDYLFEKKNIKRPKILDDERYTRTIVADKISKDLLNLLDQKNKEVEKVKKTSRLTKKDRYNHYYTNEANCRNIFSIDGNTVKGVFLEDGALAIDGKPIDKLGQLEDIEQELGIDLITLFKALKNGIYYIDKVGAYDEEHHKWLPTIEKRIVRGIEKNGLSIIDTICSYAECDGCAYYKDYGTRWALTKEELEKEE